MNKLIVGAVAATMLSSLAYAQPNLTPRLDQPSLVELSGKTILIIPSDRLFRMNSATLLPEAPDLLDNIYDIVKDHPNEQIRITANSDVIGGNITSQDRPLSEAQINSVIGYLWSRGLEFNKNITYAGVGACEPIASNHRLSGMTTNRRIQVTITPAMPQLEMPIAFRNVPQVRRYTK